MAVNYTMQAQVIDITNDTPKEEDVFFVDTNVWYWTTYPKATSFIPGNKSDYPNYLNKALGVNAKVYHSGLSLAELAHLIEDTERDIYMQKVGAIKPKEYRHNRSGQRAQVVSEIEAAWVQVENLAIPLALTIDKATTNAALARVQTEKVDGYDLFMLEAMKNNTVVQIITDDGDFATVHGIQVFTANRNVISAARQQKKLLLR